MKNRKMGRDGALRHMEYYFPGMAKEATEDGSKDRGVQKREILQLFGTSE